MQNNGKRIKDIISIIFIIVILVIGYKIYKKYNFNQFTKAEHEISRSIFERDDKIKTSSSDSYKIINTDYNDAMFYETVSVVPNTPYRATCKIRTENVESLNENTDSGAHICIADTVEKSNNVTGTSDWKEVTFYFNSKNRTSIDVGFRLGGYEDECKGTAWFSELKIEAGVTDQSNTWNFLCVLFNNIDVNINKDGTTQNIKLSLTQTDRDDINTCISRFQSSMLEMSKGKIKIKYDLVETKEPITTLSHDEENGYYVSAHDVKNILDQYIDQGKYDHIFIVFRTGNINQRGAIPVNDWIGLGYMEYRNIGFSNIRLPDDENSYIYKYNSQNNFPEEVFIHEFLHTLERNAEEYGEERPALHDYAKYGYTSQPYVSLKQWYEDYMNKKIKVDSGEIGLPQDIYTKKPTKATDFIYTHELKAFKEPRNFIEEINNILDRVKDLFSTIKNNIEQQEA